MVSEKIRADKPPEIGSFVTTAEIGRDKMAGIDDLDLRGLITNATTHVFRTMLSMAIDPMDELPEINASENRIVGTVGFAGKVVGNVSIQVNDVYSRRITAAMLGMSVEATLGAEEISDAIGELTSMIAGSVKSRLSDLGFPCDLAFPCVTTGKDFKIEHMNWEREDYFAFKYDKYMAHMEIRIKTPGSEKDVGEKALDEIIGVNIEAFITKATNEVFDMMLSMSIEQCDTCDLEYEEGHRIVGAVSFAGDVTGNVSVGVSHRFGQLITANMLGIEIEEIDDEEQINDMVGELSNMIGGSLKSKFCDSGFPCDLSIPSVTSGCDFVIESMGWEMHERYAFRHQQHFTLVEVCMKLDKK